MPGGLDTGARTIFVEAPAVVEQLSRPVDEDRLGGFGLGLLAGSFDEFAVDEGRAGADQGDQVRVR